MGRNRLTITKEKLEELYVDKGLNAKECAKELGCSGWTVLHRLDEFRIERRSRSIIRKGKKYNRRIKLTYKLLHQDYLVKGLTSNQCRRKYRCSGRTVLNRMIEFGIPRRPSKKTKEIELSYEVLYQNYVDKKLTANQCGRILGCSEGTVLKRLDKFGIERRDKWYKSIGCYNLTILERDKELAATPSILYFVEIWCGTGYWWKFGITTNSVKKRLAGLGREYLIIETKEGNLLDCYKKEQELIAKFADKQSKYGKEVVGDAGGCTEVFYLSKKDIDIALSMFESM